MKWVSRFLGNISQNIWHFSQGVLYMLSRFDASLNLLNLYPPGFLYLSRYGELPNIWYISQVWKKPCRVCDASLTVFSTTWLHDWPNSKYIEQRAESLVNKILWIQNCSSPLFRAAVSNIKHQTNHVGFGLHSLDKSFGWMKHKLLKNNTCSTKIHVSACMWVKNDGYIPGIMIKTDIASHVVHWWDKSSKVRVWTHQNIPKHMQTKHQRSYRNHNHCIGSIVVCTL